MRREYNIALRTEIARKEIRDDAKRVAEMACYMTHCKLSPLHTALALQSAMQCLHKLNCFATCAILARLAGLAGLLRLARVRFGRRRGGH